MLNLTPSYEGESVWFHNLTAVAEKIKVSADKAEEIVKKSPIHVDSEYGYAKIDHSYEKNCRF